MYIENRNSLLKKYEIAIYFGLTFLVTMILGATYQFTNNPFVSPQYAPTIAIVIIYLLSKNCFIWKNKIFKALKKQVTALWALVSLLLPISIIWF